MSRDFPVSGVEQLDAYLSALPQNMQTGAYRAGLTAAARVVRDEARARAPKKSGKMAKAIRSGSPRRNEDGNFSITVSLKGNNHAFLGLFHEYGVRPHYITAGSSDLSPRLVTRAARDGGSSDVQTQALKIGGQFVSGAVFHPGFAAKPFLRTALDIRAEDAVRAFADRIRAYIEGKTGFDASMAEAA